MSALTPGGARILLVRLQGCRAHVHYRTRAHWVNGFAHPVVGASASASDRIVVAHIRGLVSTVSETHALVQSDGHPRPQAVCLADVVSVRATIIPSTSRVDRALSKRGS